MLFDVMLMLGYYFYSLYSPVIYPVFQGFYNLDFLVEIRQKQSEVAHRVKSCRLPGGRQPTRLEKES